MVVLKNVLHMTTLKEDTDRGRISAHRVFFKCRNWETIKYVETRPPLNTMGMKTSMVRNPFSL